MSELLGAATLARIETALGQESREATIHDVKSAVIDEFERVDQRVQIHATEYFRHTFAPDLVLKWKDDVDRPERWVFLRSRLSASALIEDVRLIARDQPIVMGIGRSLTDEADTDLREATASGGTLITDVRGLESLVPAEPDAALPQLVARTVLRGGRGLYDEPRSTETTTSISRGFDAAFETSPEDTFAAARVIRRDLGERSGARLLRLLHAIWVGSGGRSDMFPDAPSADGPLGDDALELLINGPDIEDADFWRRLGSVDLPQLSRLRLSDRPENLARLIMVNADAIDGRWCRVRPDQPRAGSEDRLTWGVEAGAVALHGPRFSAYVAADKAGLDGVEPHFRGGISVEALRGRADVAEAEIADMTAIGSGLIVEVASETHGDVLGNPVASGTVGAAAGNITRATATLRNRRSVLCDFDATTASSRTNGTLTLRELIRHGLVLVWDLQADEQVMVEAMLRPVATIRSDPDQMTLFDLIADASDDAAETNRPEP